MTYVGEARVATAEEMRAADRAAIEDFGIPGEVLMENAARACVERLLDLRARRAPQCSVLCLCGPGNNGGDGLAIARTLWNLGIDVGAAYLGDPSAIERFSHEARLQHRLWERLGRPLPRLFEKQDAAWLEERLARAPLVVDAVFGTGLSRDVRDPFAGVLEAVANRAPLSLAVDLPSGLDADDGSLHGPVIPAAETVTLAAWKRGLRVGEGPSLSGSVHVAEIGIPRSVIEDLPVL